MADLRELYQEMILDHNRHPRNFRKVEGANRTAKGYNPLCGDQYELFLRVEDGIIQDIGFQGSGCAISKASASVMSSLVRGKTLTETEILFDEFHKLVMGKSLPTGDFEKLGKLAPFTGVSEFPARVKCATLAWHTLRAALQAKEEPVSTE